MQVLGIGKDDEVVLQELLLSNVNAVFRIGAQPIYSDIAPETFGSSAKAIERVLTSRTKLIVAQHSFGIPCDIRPIIQLAKVNDIFLLEDCALTLGSKIDGVVCGNFGDAALFSTDHSKPLNTMTGGLIYTQNTHLYKKLKHAQAESGSLTPEKKNHCETTSFERKYCCPERYGLFI